jgi:prepilin-type processing-associated H-X9-DG protein
MAAPAGTGTQQDPYYQYPGSYVSATTATTTTLPQVLRPADTALLSDGMSWIGGGYILHTFGCEAAEMHQSGGNFIFLDGHAKKINRNAERYLKQRADGKWFKLYFTYSME